MKVKKVKRRESSSKREVEVEVECSVVWLYLERFIRIRDGDGGHWRVVHW